MSKLKVTPQWTVDGHVAELAVGNFVVASWPMEAKFSHEETENEADRVVAEKLGQLFKDSP